MIRRSRLSHGTAWVLLILILAVAILRGEGEGMLTALERGVARGIGYMIVRGIEE